MVKGTSGHVFILSQGPGERLYIEKHVQTLLYLDRALFLRIFGKSKKSLIFGEHLERETSPVWREHTIVLLI